MEKKGKTPTFLPANVGFNSAFDSFSHKALAEIQGEAGWGMKPESVPAPHRREPEVERMPMISRGPQVAQQEMWPGGGCPHDKNTHVNTQHVEERHVDTQNVEERHVETQYVKETHVKLTHELHK